VNAPSTRSGRWWFAAAIALTIAKLWLTAAQPVFAIGPSGYDDARFLKLAESVRHGDWLGTYDHLTLAKGPFYSLWIAFWHLFGVPLFLSQHLLYAGACAALVRACRPAIASAAARFGFYALLLWNPMTFDASSLGRVLRQHVYVSLGLLLFAGLAALYFRRQETLRRQLPWAALLGLSFGAFYLTREETVWIAPSLALLAGAVLVAAARESLRTAARSSTALALAAAVSLAPILGVCALNHQFYGWFGTVEFRDPAFNDAYGAMTRVRVGPDLNRVPVTRQAREAMYAVSPTFALLRPYLDGDLGRGWADISASATGLSAEELQIGGGWLMWALRDAVAASGHTHSAAEAHAFYRAMADEIDAACDTGRLPAGPRRSGFLPIWRDGQKAAVAGTVVSFTDYTISFRGFSAFAPPSVGDEGSLALFRRMTGNRLSPTAAGYTTDPAPPYAEMRLRTLQAIGKSLRHGLFWLFVAALVVATVRAGQSLAYLEWSYPLTLAAAALGGGLASIAVHAVIHVTSFPVLTVSSFASAYPLVVLFIGAVAWDAIAAWVPAANRSVETGAAGASPRQEQCGHVVTVPADAPWRRRLPWLAGLLALAPLLLWHRQFAELYWFGDDFLLVDEIAMMGLKHWLFVFFTESFVPLFKLGWGSALQLCGGSYLAMLWLLWLTHAANTLLFGRLLLRAGFPWFAALFAQLVFALTPGNIETLAWSVQWSALLATLFLLLGLLWLENRTAIRSVWSWRVHVPLALFAAASACSFARGVLTGGVLALAVVIPDLLEFDWRSSLRRIPAAVLCLVPSAVVALAILAIPQGNQHGLGGHVAEIVRFASTFLFLSPWHQLFGFSEITPGSVALLASLKIALVGGGVVLARGRVRTLLVVLLAYDIGNALLLGIGRYHTGIHAALGPRYLYSSLLATLPSAGLLLAHFGPKLVPHALPKRMVATLLLALLSWRLLSGWPDALAPFVAWRGTEMRQLMRAPYTTDHAATVPALGFMHVERAKALQRTYNLH
jgi:hypothetical protein